MSCSRQERYNFDCFILVLGLFGVFLAAQQDGP